MLRQAAASYACSAGESIALQLRFHVQYQLQQCFLCVMNAHPATTEQVFCEQSVSST